MRFACDCSLNGEERLPTEEEKIILLDRFARRLGYERLEGEEEQKARAAMKNQEGKERQREE